MHPPISSHQRSYVPNPILLVVAVEDDDDVLVAVFGRIGVATTSQVTR